MTGLLRWGLAVLHSGRRSNWLIDCNALGDADMETLAAITAECLPPFGVVEAVPRGGLRLAAALRPYSIPGERLLIVDDVLTTGRSMEAQRAGRNALGLVLFARGPLPAWVKAIFRSFEA